MFIDLTPDAQSHAFRVAALAPHWAAQVAFMHDVIEDTASTADDIAARHGRSVADSVQVLTRTLAESYAGYIDRVARSGDRAAVEVKLADLFDHLNQSDTLKPSLEKRYRKALKVMLQVPTNSHR